MKVVFLQKIVKYENMMEDIENFTF